MSTETTEAPLRLVVLISGRGSNLQALIDMVQAKRLPADIVAVVSNRPDAYGLIRAEDANIPFSVVDHTLFDDRESFDAALQACIDSYRPDLVVLAGFMRILTPGFVNHYLGRMLNIHPSLLPKYKGVNTHARALEDGAREHGASVHFVTPELDGGPVVMQAKIAVLPSDTPKLLAERIQVQEHIIYPRVVKWFAEGRLKLHDNQVWLDGNLMKSPAMHIPEN